MQNATETLNRATSRDGTDIAYWTTGTGPPLVVVHGGAADHTRWRPLLPHLEPHATVHAMDRRGRGASGDGPLYDLARESEDVAAVVDMVANESGSGVDVYGHSHGGFCAFGAAALTRNIRRLVLYEGWPAPDPDVYALPAGVDARLDGLVSAGNLEAAVEIVFRELLQMSAEDFATFRAAPSWPGRVAAARFLPRECRAERNAALDPEVAGRITVPVLLITGENSVDPAKGVVQAVADALPDARIVTLANQEHVADVMSPELFASHLLPFMRN